MFSGIFRIIPRGYFFCFGPISIFGPWGRGSKCVCVCAWGGGGGGVTIVKGYQNVLLVAVGIAVINKRFFAS